MRFDLAGLMQAARLTVLAPREAARRIIAMQIPASTGWLGMALAVVLSALLSVISAKVSPYEVEPAYAALFASPLRLAMLQGLLLLLSLAMIMGLGRAFGGKGRLSDALVLMAWLEAVLILIQAAQMVLLLISPQIAVLLGLASFAIFLWVLAVFIAELHGFASGMKVLGMIILSFFVLSFVMALFGVGLPAGAAENV
jgi:hypothetical protein